MFAWNHKDKRRHKSSEAVLILTSELRFATSVASSARICTLPSGFTVSDPLLTETIKKYRQTIKNIPATIVILCQTITQPHTLCYEPISTVHEIKMEYGKGKISPISIITHCKVNFLVSRKRLIMWNYQNVPTERSCNKARNTGFMNFQISTEYQFHILRPKKELCEFIVTCWK